MLAFTRSTPTNSSADASGPTPGARAISGASFTTTMSSRIRMLVISESEPVRMTIAVSGDPVFAIVALMPSAIDSTDTRTATTPAMPTTATPGRGQPAAERPQVERGDDRRLEQTGEDPHGGHTLRSASTMRRRIARSAGKMPETTPSPTTSARPTPSDAFGT